MLSYLLPMLSQSPVRYPNLSCPPIQNVMSLPKQPVVIGTTDDDRKRRKAGGIAGQDVRQLQSILTGCIVVSLTVSMCVHELVSAYMCIWVTHRVILFISKGIGNVCQRTFFPGFRCRECVQACSYTRTYHPRLHGVGMRIPSWHKLVRVEGEELNMATAAACLVEWSVH